MSASRMLDGLETITSTRARAVLAAKALHRRKERFEARHFLVEGPQAVREALTVPDVVREFFITRDAADRYADLVSAAFAADAVVHVVSTPVIESIGETNAPQGVAAICDLVHREVDEVLAATSRLGVLLAQVRDPGNAGTVVRCADAAGADSVLFSDESVDPYNGKCVRASVGSLFHLPIAIEANLASTVVAAQQHGLQVLAADGAGELDLDDAADSGLLERPTLWLFGNEAWGLPEADAALADHVIRIPLHGRAESLNLSTAAAVCLYASARAQRRTFG